MRGLQFSAPVAQLDRVPGYEPGGRRFESFRARQLKRPAHGGFFYARPEGFEPPTGNNRFDPEAVRPENAGAQRRPSFRARQLKRPADGGFFYARPEGFEPPTGNNRFDPEALDFVSWALTGTGAVLTIGRLEILINVRGVAQPGSATALGAVGRRFKSCRPDQLYPCACSSTG